MTSIVTSQKMIQVSPASTLSFFLIGILLLNALSPYLQGAKRIFGHFQVNESDNDKVMMIKLI